MLEVLDARGSHFVTIAGDMAGPGGSAVPRLFDDLAVRTGRRVASAAAVSPTTSAGHLDL
jgi:hypothetical protein